MWPFKKKSIMIKTCATCVHCELSRTRCHRKKPKPTLNIITGKVESRSYKVYDCESERGYWWFSIGRLFGCGKRGRYWKDKNKFS